MECFFGGKMRMHYRQPQAHRATFGTGTRHEELRHFSPHGSKCLSRDITPLVGGIAEGTGSGCSGQVLSQGEG